MHPYVRPLLYDLFLGLAFTILSAGVTFSSWDSHYRALNGREVMRGDDKSRTLKVEKAPRMRQGSGSADTDKDAAKEDDEGERTQRRKSRTEAKGCGTTARRDSR